MNDSKRASGGGAPLGSKRLLFNEIILVAVILILALGVLLVFHLGGVKGAVVNVIIDGEKAYSFPLGEDLTKTLTFGEHSEFTNVLVIKDGEAYVERANCPDKICVAHRKISKSGETVVCLPHRLVIEIE